VASSLAPIELADEWAQLGVKFFQPPFARDPQI